MVWLSFAVDSEAAIAGTERKSVWMIAPTGEVNEDQVIAPDIESKQAL